MVRSGMLPGIQLWIFCCTGLRPMIAVVPANSASTAPVELARCQYNPGQQGECPGEIDCPRYRHVVPDARHHPGK